jgi:hypothetical protein
MLGVLWRLDPGVLSAMVALKQIAVRSVGWMGNVWHLSSAELKKEIVSLSFEERAELNRLLSGWEDDEWDKPMAVGRSWELP